MKRTLTFFFLILFAAHFASAEQAYIIELNYVDGVMTYSSLLVTDASLPPKSVSGRYSAEVRNFEGYVQYKTSFDPSEGPLTVIVPYEKTSSEIMISSSTDSLRIPVAHFADTCGNDACEPHEGFEICPDDCEKEKPDKTIVEQAQAAEELVKKFPEEEIVQKSSLKPTGKDAGTLELAILMVFALILLAVALLAAMFIITKREAYIREYAERWNQQGYQMNQIRQGLKGRYMNWEINRALRK